MAERRPKRARPAARKTSPGKPPDTSARAAALAALGRIFDHGVALETALSETPGFNRMAPRDRAFARLLAATYLRRAGEIAAVTGRLLEKPLPTKEKTAARILGLGLTQLLWLATPAHAAVATAVALADERGARRFKALINAVLRRAAREGTSLTDGFDSARMNTPDWLWDAWSAAYGEDTARAIAEAHLAEPPLDITPRDPSDAATLAALLEAEVLLTGTLRRAGRGAIPELPGYAEGRWWVQDAAAALPARLLGDVNGKRVLDMCAAPGGKTLQLAAAGAQVTALDISGDRLVTVAANLSRTGLNAELATGDGRTWESEPFDAVLLDAPCSATGTARRHPDIPRTRRPGDVARAAGLQDALIANAARLVAPGGTLVYAVCSLERPEGAERVSAFLNAHEDFATVPVTAPEIGGLEGLVTPEGYLRTLPSHLADRGGMDGFFAARLRRRQ